MDAEIIVVDNASSDGSYEVAASFPGVQVIACKRNLGYGRANNIGLRRARGQHLLILNPDTVPQAHSIERLVAFQRACPQACIVSPRLLNSDGSVQEAAFRFPTLAMASLDLFPLPRIIPGRLRRKLYTSTLNGRYPNERRADSPFKIDHPLGACILISRTAYAQAGGFDPRIFMYAEEIDLAMRYAQHGWECWQVPQAEVVHLGGQSTRQTPDRMQVELWRSRLYLYRKHYSLMQQLALALLVILAQVWWVANVLIHRTLGKASRSEARQTLARAAQLVSLVFGR